MDSPKECRMGLKRRHFLLAGLGAAVAAPKLRGQAAPLRPESK